MQFLNVTVLNLSKTICSRKTIWNRCCSLLGKDKTDLILLTSYNGKVSNMPCINPLSLIFGITLVANEKTVLCCRLYKVWNTINIAEALMFVMKSTVTNIISRVKKGLDQFSSEQNSVSNYGNTEIFCDL